MERIEAPGQEAREEKEPRVPEEIGLVSRLVEGELLFDSWGTSTVMTTKEGRPRPLVLRIRSTGVAEYIERLRAEAPRPPSVSRHVLKDSEEGIRLGVPHDMVVRMFDLTDKAYIEALDRHNQEYTWRVVIFALDLDWRLADGREAVAYEEKKRVLRSNAIDLAQINRIFLDVQNLTRFREERADFLSGA